MAEADPSGPWKPELTHRPRLLWTDAQWPEITGRLDREPYATLYARVRSRANGTPAARPEFYNPPREYSAANIAKDAAFSFAVDGTPTLGAKAETILLDMATEFNYDGVGGLYTLLDYDIHVAEAVQSYCAAFDILAGSGYFESAAQQQAARDRLEEMVGAAWQFYLVDWYAYHSQNNNNHFVKLAAAFGTAAITLNDSDEASEWIHHAMAWGTEKLWSLVVPGDGTYAEGPSYHVYSAGNYIPFFLQYDRFTDGESGTFEQRTCNLLGQNCWYEPVEVTNPLDHQRLQELTRWTVDLRMPDGRCPPVGDSFAIGNLNGLLGAAWSDPELLWDWFNKPAAPGFTGYHADNTADLLCLYDDGVEAAQPDRGPSVAFPDTAAVAFRTDWSGAASYFLFTAEKGPALHAVPGHEQADTLSFLYYADGQMLAIDSGYIKWDRRDEVRFGIDHNVVAIDGEGPPAINMLGEGGVDGDITMTDLSGAPEYAVGNTYYSDTQWTRGVFFYGPLAVVCDLLVSDGEHEYRLLLHGNGGGDTGGTFAMQDSGARWAIEDAGLTLSLAATGAVVQGHYQDLLGWTWSQEVLHEVYEGAINASVGGFVSVLQTDEADGFTIDALDLPDGSGGFAIETGGATDYFLVGRWKRRGRHTNRPVRIRRIGVRLGAAGGKPGARGRASVIRRRAQHRPANRRVVDGRVVG